MTREEAKSNKINSIIKEMHKDQMDIMNLLKLYVGMETLALCVTSLDPEDKNYKILHDYLMARMEDLNDLSHEAHLSIFIRR